MSVYGAEGYGWYWILVEMMREQSDFTLKLKGKYTFNALAMQMHCNPNATEQFVHDCINEFGLFESDGESFWSNSLLRRMAMKEEISQKRKKAAEARWNKKADKSTSPSDENSNGMQMHNTSNANGMQGKEKKVKESKLNKRKYKDYVSMTTEQYEKLLEQFGESGTEERMENLNLYKGSTGKKYKDDYLTILAWERKNKKNSKHKSKEDFDLS